MPPKTAQKTKEQKLKAALSGGKGRKKKWGKGKVKEKMMNAILFDKPTYDRGMKEIPKTKVITPSVVSDRIKVNGSLARAFITHLAKQDLIQRVGDAHHTLQIFTRIADAEEAPAKK